LYFGNTKSSKNYSKYKKRKHFPKASAFLIGVDGLERQFMI